MSESFRFPKRIEGVRALLAREQVEGVIVSQLENVRYLTGFTGSNGLALLTPKAAIFLTDGRYAVQSAHEVSGLERVILSQAANFAEVTGEQSTRLVV